MSTNKFSVVVICAPLDSSQPYEEVGLYPGARTIARLARDSQVRYPNIGDLVMLDKSHQFIVAPLANPSSFEALFLGSNRYSDPSLLSMHRDISRRELRNQWGNELGVEPPRSKREKKLHALRGLEIICSELRIMKAQASVLSVIAGGVEPHNEKNMVFTFFPLLKDLGAAVMSDVIADAVPTLPYDVANTVSSFEYFSPLSQEVLLALFTGRKGYKHWIDRGGNVCTKIFRRQMKPRYCGSLRGRESLSRYAIWVYQEWRNNYNTIRLDREIESDSESSSSDSSTEIIDYALITYMFLYH